MTIPLKFDTEDKSNMAGEFGDLKKLRERYLITSSRLIKIEGLLTLSFFSPLYLLQRLLKHEFIILKHSLERDKYMYTFLSLSEYNNKIIMYTHVHTNDSYVKTGNC